jgi:hypothetical protein
MSDNQVKVRGSNYNWEEEAKHYQAECKKLRDLIQKLEASSEELAFDRYRYKKALQKLTDKVANSLLLDERLADDWQVLCDAVRDASIVLYKE